MSSLPPTSIDTSAQRGAFIKSAYVEREMKAYAVYEQEIDSLAHYNSQATAFFSIASFLAALACGIWTNAAFATDKLPAEGAVLAKFIGPLLIVIALIFVWLGASARGARKKILSEIKSQSKST